MMRLVIFHYQKKIQNKHALIDVKTLDNVCFFCSIVSLLYPVSNHSCYRTSYPDYKTLLKTDGLDMPMKMHDTDRFEGLNAISVIVYLLIYLMIMIMKLNTSSASKVIGS